MSHRQGVIDVRRIAAVAFVLLLSFAVAASVASIAAPGADAKGKKAKVSLKIATKNQAALLKQKGLSVRVTSTGKAKVKVTARNFQARTVNFKKKGKKTIKLKLTKQGRPKLSLCGAQKVNALGKYGKRKARAGKTLGRDSSRCITVPLGDNPEKCDFLDTTVCLQPFANDYYTVNDPSTPTGKKLNIAADATPSNLRGGTNPRIHIDPTDMNRGDGFSPGNMIVLKVPGLDTPAAFENSNLVPITDQHAYDDPNQSVMVIDAETGERHPIWAEIDENPTSVDPTFGPDGPDPGTAPDLISPGGPGLNPTNTDPVNLIIRPAVNWDHSKRYIVVLRNLKNANNQPIASPPAFRTYRDSVITTQGIVEQRRAHMNSVIKTAVDKAGVKRSSMYMAWDFTVASAETTTSRALTIRDDAFERLGDSNLANRTIEGTSPQWTVTSTTAPSGNRLRQVRGTLDNVPCYLNSPNCNPGGTFEFDANDELVWNPASTTDVPFQCNIPNSVLDLAPGSTTPAQTGTYGHGLLGSLGQVNGQDRVGYDGNTIWCAVDWAGFASEDQGTVLSALADMSNFPKLVDRMQQGFVNFLYLQRALVHSSGMTTDLAFQVDPDGAGPKGQESTINTSLGINTRGQYMGISQGGIMGGALTALSPDADYSVLGVPGINYSTLLRRSVDSDDYFKNPSIGLYRYYPEEEDRALLLSLIQLLWDRGEGNGYAHFTTDTPLPDTPPHEVLLRVAYGDHQVANVTAEVAARTFGAKVYYPALQPGRHWDVDPFFGMEKVTDFPFQNGSMMVYYDGGPETFFGRSRQGAAVPPNGNLPPRKEWGFGDDPHGQPRAAKSGVRHAVTFLNGPDLNLGATRGVIESCAVTGVGDYFETGNVPIPAPDPGDARCYSNGWNGKAGVAP